LERWIERGPPRASINPAGTHFTPRNLHRITSAFIFHVWTRWAIHLLGRNLPRRCPLNGKENYWERISSLHRGAARKYIEAYVDLEIGESLIGTEAPAG
jgi:hypothetical protein